MPATPLQNPTTVTPAAPVVAAPGAPAPATANQMYEAARAHRREFLNQQERVNEQREEIRDELAEGNSGPAERAGMEARLKDLDARNLQLDQQIAVADLRVAEAAAVPGATTEPARPIVQRTGPPEEAWVLGGFFIVCVMMPIAFAYARRVWRRAPATPAEMPAELTDRLSRLEQAVDAVAVELERVGEGQRYVTRALGAGAADPLEIRQREAARQSRP